MKGGSGATLERAVVKFGEGEIGARVGRQGEWLAAHQHIRSLPRVFCVWSHGYAMEAVKGFQSPEGTWQIINTLETEFWNHPAEVDIDIDRHLRFVRSRCDAHYPEAWKDLEEWCGKIDWPGPVLIHGDPTFSNLARRSNGELVICDPNPASERVPSVAAEDLANLCQSLLGYEQIKYGWKQAFARPLLDDEAVRYLTAVKFIRICAYEPDRAKADRFREIAARLIARR